MSEQTALNATAQAVQAETAGRRSLRRLGCGLLLALWFLLMMTPCALFYLAANGEIRLDHADIPQPHSHPLLLITLINDVENRGLQFVRSTSLADREDDTVCVETAVNYLLWVSSGGSQDVTYCDCFARESGASAWDLQATHSSACE